MKSVFSKIKNYFDQDGIKETDFWLIFTLGFAVIGILFDKISFVGLAILPTFLAGYFFAETTWTEGEEMPEITLDLRDDDGEVPERSVIVEDDDDDDDDDRYKLYA